MGRNVKGYSPSFRERRISLTSKVGFYTITAIKIGPTVADLYQWYAERPRAWQMTTNFKWSTKDIKESIMIINGKCITPDLWEQIKDLEITDGLNHLYKIGYFGDIAPTHDADGKPYESVFQTGVKFDFNVFRTWDYTAEIVQLEYFMRLKYKYNRDYSEQLEKLEAIHEKLRILNVLHE